MYVVKLVLLGYLAKMILYRLQGECPVYPITGTASVTMYLAQKKITEACDGSAWASGGNWVLWGHWSRCAARRQDKSAVDLSVSKWSG